MRITDKAKVVLQKVMMENERDCLWVGLQETCCGTSISVALAIAADDDKVIEINGVPVIMQPDAIERASSIEIDEQDGQLFFNDSQAADCASCSH
jgi:Fe-S cluster assembly iron-binding protein IscA